MCLIVLGSAKDALVHVFGARGRCSGRSVCESHGLGLRDAARACRFTMCGGLIAVEVGGRGWFARGVQRSEAGS